MQTLSKMNGITLIALVVTIIVLLILAGVSLGLVFNSDGLFEKANSAASKYNASKEEEQDFLQKADEYLDKYNGIYGGGSSTGTPNPTGTATPTLNPTPALPAIGEEPPEAGWTIEQAKGLVERDGLQAHLGEKVAYQPAQDTTGVYRIFYYDNEPNSEDATKGYFGDEINTLYLKRDYVSSDTNLSSYTSYATTDNGTLMKQMNPKWSAAENGSSIDLANEHCVAWLCDSSQWTRYKVEGVANYAIGSPSVEMYMKAYNVYKDNNANSTTLINKIGSINGYSVGTYNDYAWNGKSEYSTGEYSIEAGPSNIFRSGSRDWWLASPVSRIDDSVLCIYAGYPFTIGNQQCDLASATYGFCPVVSISQ